MSKPSTRTSPIKSRQQAKLTDGKLSPSMRQTFISVRQDNNRQQPVDVKIYTTAANKFIKDTNLKNYDQLPPKAVPFQRSRSRENSFRDKQHINNDDLDRYKSQDQVKQSPKSESVSKMNQLKKKVSQQIAEKQKLKEINTAKQQKIINLNHQLDKYKQQNKWLHQQIQQISHSQQQSQKQLIKANQLIQVLNKTINNFKTSQKPTIYNKATEVQLQSLQSKLQKLTNQNKQLIKTVSQLKKEGHSIKISLIQNDKTHKQQTVYSLQLQINRLKKQLQKDKSQRQKLLELTIRELQKNLYEKQNDLRRSSVHINLLGRKQAFSIDEVRSKKDQQIKIIRQKFMKVSKDLRETRDKIQKSGKKKNQRDSIYLRKIKSNKQIKLGSQSEEFTFELSSEV